MTEENVTAGGEQTSAAGAQELHLLLEDARAKADAHWDQVLRARAELENFRKRAERDIEAAHKYGLERIIGELLPVLDSLESGLAAAAGQGAVDKLVEGMTLTHKLLGNVLDKFNVKTLDPVGQKFDPKLHQAMSAVESSDSAPDTVLTVCQKGYLLHDRVIRPALVIVAKAPAADAGA
ncbi:MAG: nucleotide exchange factor GrpE [Gammaproteobacteria bacterium]|nr:nucleotide exchange factor GrpE [Gammaproteobacteria bacterium]